MSGTLIEVMLKLWVSELRDAKARMRCSSRALSHKLDLRKIRNRPAGRLHCLVGIAEVPRHTAQRGRSEWGPPGKGGPSLEGPSSRMPRTGYP
jgi:hypothetical protein